MAKPKRSKSPWRDGGCFATISGKRRNIVIESADGREIGRIISGPDAHLAIAAPDLYDALDALQSIIPDNAPGLALAFRANARAVLAKARGEVTNG